MKTIGFWLVLGVFLMAPGLAEARSGEEVMRAVYDQARIHKNQSAEVTLRILDGKGGERVRYFRSLYKIFPDRTKSLIKFYRPANVRGVGLLNETAEGGSDTLQWFYLPALRSVKRLSAGDKHKSFMGSDFTNADVAGRKVEEDSHEIVSEDSEMIVVRSKPLDGEDIYGRIETHILSGIHVPGRIVFYDRGGEKIKTLVNEKIRKVKGMYTVSRAVMSNHKTGGATRLEKKQIDVESTIDSNEVGFKGLRH